MPIKKGKIKGSDAKKKVNKSTLKSGMRGKTLQNQKPSQVQKVVVNINKQTSKPKYTKREANIISKGYSIYQSSPIAYPSYQRQAEAIPVTIPISSGRTLGAEPSNKLVSENLLKSSGRTLDAEPSNKLGAEQSNNLVSENLLKSELSDIYASDKYDFFVAENPLLKNEEQVASSAKRSYVKQKLGPRRNSLEDLKGRYYAIKGEDPPLMKAKDLKNVVEELEAEYKQKRG